MYFDKLDSKDKSLLFFMLTNEPQNWGIHSLKIVTSDYSVYLEQPWETHLEDCENPTSYPQFKGMHAFHIFIRKLIDFNYQGTDILSMAKTFIENGVDVHATDSSGLTVFDYLNQSDYNQKESIIRYLSSKKF